MTEEIHPRRRRCRLRRGGRQDLSRSSSDPSQSPTATGTSADKRSPHSPPKPQIPRGEPLFCLSPRSGLSGADVTLQTSPPFFWPRRSQTRKGNRGTLASNNARFRCTIGVILPDPRSQASPTYLLFPEKLGV